MTTSPDPDLTRLLLAWGDGDREALDRLMPLVYAELHGLARRYLRGQRRDVGLQTTALVNEAYLRLIDAGRVQWQNRAHFFGISARLLRQILVDIARSRDTQKRGGHARHVPLEEALAAGPAPDEDLVALDEALKELAAFDARKAEVVELRFFGGLTLEEAAEALDVSPETIKRDWRLARSWLRRRLEGGAGE